MEPLLETHAPPSPALAHVVALSSHREHRVWSTTALFAALGVAATELHSWGLLSTRAVVGCAEGAGVPVPANATLASCASLGFFDGVGAGGATLTTAPPPAWSSGLFLALCGVCALWVAAAWVVAGQSFRASALLPYGIYVHVKTFNRQFYSGALVCTVLYMLCKYAAFGAQPTSVTVTRGGRDLTAALAGTFAPVGPVGQGGLAALGASLATLWLSFAGISALVLRHAADAYADVTVSALVECSAAGGGACDSHDVRAAGPGGTTAVLAALAAPMLRLDSREVDVRLRRWWEVRGLKPRVSWLRARWLRGCDAELTRDAVEWVRDGGGVPTTTYAVQ